MRDAAPSALSGVPVRCAATCAQCGGPDSGEAARPRTAVPCLDAPIAPPGSPPCAAGAHAACALRASLRRCRGAPDGDTSVGVKRGVLPVRYERYAARRAAARRRSSGPGLLGSSRRPAGSPTADDRAERARLLIGQGQTKPPSKRRKKVGSNALPRAGRARAAARVGAGRRLGRGRQVQPPRRVSLGGSEDPPCKEGIEIEKKNRRKT